MLSIYVFAAVWDQIASEVYAEIRQVGFIAARSPSINSSTCVSNRGNLRSAEVKLQLERDCLAQEVALNEAAESKLQLERDCLAQEIILKKS